MSLTDTAIKALQPQEKIYKVHDSMGMYLLVHPNGGKYFRMDYKFHEKRKTISFGVYPRTKLKAARQKVMEARDLLESGIDPAQHKKDMKNFNVGQGENSFEKIALEWFSKNKGGWSAKHTQTVISRLTQNVFPWLGKMEIDGIKTPDLLSVFRRIEERGAIEVAHRTKQICGQVFRYGIAIGKCERDLSVDLKGALTPSVPKNMSTITDPAQIGGLLRSIDDYPGFFVTRCALKLLPLVFLRSAELRGAEWSEIDLEKAEWKISPERMKMKRVHIIPLAPQAVEVFKDVQPLTGDEKYVFPSVKSNTRVLSSSALLSALRRMGYTNDEMCVHGFRAMASTLLHENGFPSHIIELQLAHVESNGVKAAYNHALYMKERTEMMQWWASHLDQLKNK